MATHHVRLVVTAVHANTAATAARAAYAQSRNQPGCNPSMHRLQQRASAKPSPIKEHAAHAKPQTAATAGSTRSN